MLVVSRNVGESIVIGDAVVVTVVRVEGGRVRVAVEAPAEVRVDRAEIAERRRNDERGAA
jgi:carbon storage regulator